MSGPAAKGCLSREIPRASNIMCQDQGAGAFRILPGRMRTSMRRRTAPHVVASAITCKRKLRGWEKRRGRIKPSLHSAPALDGVAGDVRDMPVADESRPKRARTDTAGCRLPVPLSWNTDTRSLLLRIQEGYETDPLYRSNADSEREQHKLSMTSDGCYERGPAVAVPADKDIRRSIIRELHDSPYVGHFGISINQSINFIVCLGTYAQIHQTIYMFSAEWKNVPLLALLQEMCDPHRGVAGDQIRHGISFPK